MDFELEEYFEEEEEEDVLPVVSKLIEYLQTQKNWSDTEIVELLEYITK